MLRSPPDTPEKPQPQPRLRVLQFASAAQPAPDAAPGDALDLWVDQSGHLIFNSADKFQAYRRCRADANAAHRDASACNSIAPQESPQVALNHRVSRGWH